MAEAKKQSSDLPVSDLARDCAQQTSRRHTPPRELDPCYKLFRQACVSQCEDAWQAIIVQYRRLVLYWLGQYGDDDNCQEVFLRFWKGQQTNDPPFTIRFENTSAIVGFLKSCAVTTRIECWQKEDRRREVKKMLRGVAQRDLVHAPSYRDDVGLDFKSLILSKLKNDQERFLFELMYYYNLKPRDIQAERPDVFPDMRTVYRVKENLLKRLRRDAELQECWADWSRRSENGGN
jgi:DNA-directed RNA polymerase specialized sigma24 family protein